VKTLFTYLILLLSLPLAAQELLGPPEAESSVLDIFITENNDTLYIADLPMISVTSSALSGMDLAKYRRLKRNTTKVLPYALQAVDLIEEIETVSATIEKKRHRRKYLKKLEDELKDNFKSDLKKLTTTQGKILIKIIERETDDNFYAILKGLKNPVTAFFFQAIGKRFGYDLKEGYDLESQTDLEKVLVELEEDGEFIKAREKDLKAS